MTAFERQIEEAVGAVRLHSATRFSWMGERSERLPARIERSLEPEAARGYLSWALANVLYANFYCSGHAQPSGNGAGRANPDGDAALVGALSTANSGTGCWQPGWTIEGRDERAASVRRGGLTLRAQPGDCRSPDASGNALVRFPKESLRFSPGFYMALGDAGLALDEPIVRLYWNLSPDGAVRFIAAGTQAFNASGLAVRMKVVNDRAGFDRRDAGVIYLRRADFGAATPLIRDLLTTLGPSLRAGAPALTHPVATGLALAEDPGGGESFGLSRCALIAEGLARAAERGDAPIAGVHAALEQAGVDRSRPYLSPGSEHRYGLD